MLKLPVNSEFVQNVMKYNIYSSYKYLERSYSGETPFVSQKGKWQSVVGLEVHAQINTASKMFSACGTEYMTPPNMQVSFFDAALPGTLPVLNRKCVEAGVLTALALNCTIHKESSFDRKHYFYADMPAGYQITQQRQPLATDGYLEFVVFNPAIKLGPYTKRSRLIQLQLEQDSGKSLHDELRKRSLIDLNRAGVGLMELVFDADLKNGEECSALVKELQLILRRLGTCSGQMEEGALRVDANISINQHGEARGTRTELKNLNSFRFLANAVDLEIERQVGILENGGIIVNETRSYDMKSKMTLPMRDKEEVQDYRFMPEPNLPPLRLAEEECNDNQVISISQLRRSIPLLPQDERKRLLEFRIKEEHAIILVNHDLSYLFCELMEKKRNPAVVAIWLRNIFLGALNERNLKPCDCPVTLNQLNDIVELVESGVITTRTSGDILALLFNGDKRHPLTITKEYNWERIHDLDKIENICRTVMEKNVQTVKKVKKGKKKALEMLLLQAKIECNGRADMITVKEIFLKLIEK